MRPLTAELGVALANLGRKNAGETVGWISISAAQALVEMGLAQRVPSGWVVTPAGSARLAEERSQAPGPDAGAEIVKFANDEEIADHGRV